MIRGGLFPNRAAPIGKRGYLIRLDLDQIDQTRRAARGGFFFAGRAG